MRAGIVLTITLNSLATLLAGQGNSGDCSGAVVMKDNTFKVISVNGHGKTLEIKGNELGNAQYFTEEHNTIWIRFKAGKTGEMTFNIIPDQPGDDWDFMLFKGGLSDCGGIAARDLKPVRSNLARNDLTLKGRTGLSREAKNEYVAAGVHPNYSRAINVKENVEFTLVVDIIQNSGHGFTFQVEVIPEKMEAVINEFAPSSSGLEFVDMTESSQEKEKIAIRFRVLDERTGTPVKCNAEVINDGATDTLKYNDISDFDVAIPGESWFYVNVKKEGYTFSTEKYKSTQDLAAGTQIIYISEMKAGNRIVLKEIVFRENTTHLLPTSINALEQLIAFMREYPSAKIEIQGHVNAPGYDNDGKVNKMSVKRAEQIKIYLVDAGIEGKRINVRGMGNEFMIYPNPQSYEQEKANRRVEIEILSL